LVGGASKQEYACLSNFGKNFGIAYQLEDDLLDLKNGEEVSDDLKKGRVSLPLIHLYSMSNLLEKKVIDEELWIATKKDDIESEKAIKDIIRRLEETDSIKYVENKIDQYRQMANASLAPLKDNRYKLSLLQLLKLLERS